MTEEEALEAAICADPNDRRAWSVYGDWLISQGDPRGEAISLWNRLRDAVLPQEERRALSERYEELCAPETWLADLPEEQLERMLAEPSEDFEDWEDSEGWEALEDQRPVLFGLEWRHGFVLGADLDLTDPSWREALAVFRDLPAARLFCRAGLIGLSQDDLKPLLATGILRRVRSLEVEGVDAPVLLKLLSSPLLGELESLDFTISSTGDEDEELIPVDPAWAEAFVELPSLAKLRVLRVGPNTLNTESFQALTALLSRLEALDVSENEIGPEGAVALAASGSRLRTLILRGCGLRDQGAASLADSVALRGLRKLELAYNHLTQEGAKALATSLLVELTHLDIGVNGIGNAGLRALLRSPVLSKLQVLRARESGLSRRYDTSGYEDPTEVYLALPHLTEFACNERRYRMERETQTIGARQVDYYTSSTE